MRGPWFSVFSRAKEATARVVKRAVQFAVQGVRLARGFVVRRPWQGWRERHSRLTLISVLALYVLAAYALTRFPAPIGPPTAIPTHTSPRTKTPIVTSTQPGLSGTSVAEHPLATAPATSTPRASLTPIPLQTGCVADPTTSAVRYDLDATADVDAHSVDTVLHIDYRNETGATQSHVVFNVEPNRKPGVFMLNSLEVASPAALSAYALNGARLDATLRQPLEPHCEAVFTINFTDKPGPIVQTYIGNTGYFGYTDRQMNLAVWMPEVAPYLNGDFFTPKPWPLGEYIVSDLSDYTARVTVVGKDKDKREAIGPGDVQKVGANTWAFSLLKARSFNFSIDRSMSKLTATSDSGAEIDFYYFTVGSTSEPASSPQPTSSPAKTAEAAATSPATAVSVPSIPGAAAFALETARKAVNRYATLYGDPPFKRLVIVEGEFPDGMEFSGIVFVSKTWFSQYTGQPDTLLTVITAHEVSHQWWYSEVGNDQGNEPFLDEGLAIYSESVFMEKYYPALLPWWWSFRIKSFAPQGYVDSTIYDFQNLRSYLNAVYLRGALMLQDLRTALGDDAFFKWIRDYLHERQGKIATAQDFWQALSPADYIKTGPVRAKYLHNPDPLHLMPAATGAATALATGVATAPTAPTAPNGPATVPCCG